MFIWPKVKRRISITDMKFESTLSASSINDRLLAIIPFEIGENNLNGLNGEKNICCIVEILSIEKHENKINLEVIGRRRFILTEFRNAVIEENLPHLFVCSGEILKDLEIESEAIINENIKNHLAVYLYYFYQHLFYNPDELIARGIAKNQILKSDNAVRWLSSQPGIP